MAEIGPVPKAFAINEFDKKLRSKISGGYKVVEMNYSAEDEKKEEKKKPVK